MEGTSKNTLIAVFVLLIIVGFGLAGYCFYTNRQKDDFKRRMFEQRNLTNKKLSKQKEEFEQRNKIATKQNNQKIEMYKKTLNDIQEKFARTQKVNQEAFKRQTHTENILANTQNKLNSVIASNNQRQQQMQRARQIENMKRRPSKNEEFLTKETFLPSPIEGSVGGTLVKDLIGGGILVGGGLYNAAAPDELLRSPISIESPSVFGDSHENLHSFREYVMDGVHEGVGLVHGHH